MVRHAWFFYFFFFYFLAGGQHLWHVRVHGRGSKAIWAPFELSQWWSSDSVWGLFGLWGVGGAEEGEVGGRDGRRESSRAAKWERSSDEWRSNTNNAQLIRPAAPGRDSIDGYVTRRRRGDFPACSRRWTVRQKKSLNEFRKFRRGVAVRGGGDVMEHDSKS